MKKNYHNNKQWYQTEKRRRKDKRPKPTNRSEGEDEEKLDKPNLNQTMEPRGGATREKPVEGTANRHHI